MKIAVVGGGLFGCTAAIYAARAGHDVTLYEARSGLMLGATASTYSRLHRGFHYPRSPETGRESRLAESSFRAEYGAAVIDTGRQFYIVPSRGSRVTPEQFQAFLDREGLDRRRSGNVFEVEEPRINLAGLQCLVRQKVAEAGITVRLDAQVYDRLEYGFDRVVVAAYAGTNDVLAELGRKPGLYKFQVVERPLALLPESLKKTSIVVIDGPFGCLDPLDGTPLHVLGHVVHAVHAENVGESPDVPEHLEPLIGRGLIRQPRSTKFGEVVEDLSQWIPDVRKAVYAGSSFTVRAVLANKERTDARPTLVERVDSKVIKVFSGKLGTAVRAAREVLGMIEQREAIAA